MKSGHRKLIGIVCAYSVALVCGLGGYASQVHAQTAGSLGADAPDRKLQKQVAAALHANPYLDDEHINTSVEKGVVVLGGLVFDDWDVRTALRTARKVTGRDPVIDSLSIEQGGR
jgi:osmotically-inducible protein OsmY